MGQFFYKIYQWIANNKIKTTVTLILLFGGLLFLASQLKFEEDITKLIPENEEAKTLNKVLKQVDFADKIVVLINKTAKGNTEDLLAVATKFNDSIHLFKGDYIESVQGIIEDDDFEESMNFIDANLPLFLNDADYNTITNNSTARAIAKKTAENYKSLISPSGIITRKTLLKDPLGISFLGLSKLKDLQLGDDFMIKDGFVITEDERNVLLFIKPKLASNETDKNAIFVDQLNQLKDYINTDYKDKVELSYYGSTVVAVANASQIKHDIQLTVTIALSVLFLILILFYKRVYIPVVLLLPTVFGALLAIASLYVFRGTISAISIGIGSVLLGITLDYSLHILTHHRSTKNMQTLYSDVAKPIIMSGITTALAFLCLLFINSRALQDLGIFASVSVLGASFFALILIPHLYRKKQLVQVKKTNLLDKFSSISFEKKRIIVFSCLTLVVLALFFYNDVKFDKDISKMNYQSEELIKTEKELNDLINTSSKSLYLVSHGNTYDEALQANNTVFEDLKTFKEQQRIIDFSAVSGIVLPVKEQQRRLDKWNSFWQREKDSVHDRLVTSGLVHGFKPATFNQFYEKINSPLTLEDINTEFPESFLTDEFIAEKDNFHTVLSSVKVANDKAAAIANHFAKSKNTVVIDRQAMNETFLSNFKDNFDTLLRYSFVAVVIVLLLFFRSIVLVLITIAPIAITWLITIGLMGLLNIQFNIFNIIISTFIFGLGVDYAIFMTNGLIKEYETGKKHLQVYRVSIILSMITTILGVGVLIFAKHPALKSISIVSLIGITTAVLTTFVFQPILFRALITNRAKKGLAPLTLRKTIHSIFSFTFYGLGGMILSVIAIIVFKTFPLSKARKFKWLRRAMAQLAISVLYSNPFVTKRVIKDKNALDKEAMIIANHTSFLDTLAIALVAPKVIFLVNDWVYKSPIFGQLVKMAEYYPVSKGIEESVPHLKKKVDQGYSLIVFPEGKRMYSNKIGRFHKGAFLLAKELNLDILPLYIHGNAEVLPKGDHIIYNGAITTKLSKRIEASHPIFKEDVKSITRFVSNYYRNEFQEIRDELEDVDYFKEKLLDNYRYKSLSIQKEVTDDFKRNKVLYHLLNTIIPLKTKLLHIGNDYGQIDIFLKYKSNDRKITSYISEENRRVIAKNNYVGVDYPITYLDEIQQNKEEVLVFGLNVEHFNHEFDLNAIKMIIILNQNLDTSSFIKHGFVVATDSNILVLKK